MDILNFIFDYITKGNGEKFKPILKLLSENNFDIKKVLSNLNLTTIAPILMELLSNNKTPPTTEVVEEEFNLKPIQAFADEEIVFRLNNYLNY